MEVVVTGIRVLPDVIFHHIVLRMAFGKVQL